MKVTLDPTKEFTSVPQERLVDALGFIPEFVVAAFELFPEGDSAEDVYNAMVKVYRYGDYRFLSTNGGEVDSEGVYRYPEDPDLHPLVCFEQGDVKVFVYQHAIISVRDSRDTIVSRMD